MRTILQKHSFSLLCFLLFIVCSHSICAQSINITGPVGSGRFGTTVTVLPNGNYVVTDPLFDDGAITDVGAVYLYNGSTHALISTLKGSTANNQVGSGGITVLSNGNYVLRSPNWDNGAATDAGAVTWGSGSTGISGVVSSSNSMVGSTAGDGVGGGAITVLSNGNYVMRAQNWDNGAATNAGATTWGNGITGTSGVVNSSNSLVGSATNDQVGSGGIYILNNSNYLVRSGAWRNAAATSAGAVTWCNGSTGTTGVVSSTNSLVGSTTNDQIGAGGITVLNNGNYLVPSPGWDNGAVTNVGAVTWGNGSTGITGVVSSSNSLVGSTANDNVSFNGITSLSNGNYVVLSAQWDNVAITDAGAATWGNGSTGITGAVSSSNSLVGSAASDQIGISGITILGNGNYVLGSPNWDNGAITNAGAATWCNGSTGTTGLISSSNSLVGSTANDLISSNGITVLSNGNYLVGSPNWDNGAATDAGAATWGNGTTGTSGVVSISNSLVGTTAGEMISSSGCIALSNGNYVVGSIGWINGAFSVVGAATWGNGSTGTAGVVSSSNSLVGSTVGDNVGISITPLSNGNYVVGSYLWDNGAATDVGAATWCNGSTGTTGVVNSSNSLVGSTASDYVGISITALSNGNYVVKSDDYWDNGAATNAGAVTWGNGSIGITGVVSSGNSLVGSTANDHVGASIIPLSNGNYVVASQGWDNGAVTDAGATTWCNGSTGTNGVVSSGNSLVGSTANDGVGANIVALNNGNYLVRSTAWDNGAVSNAGAATWGNGSTGTSGVISSSNSLVGSRVNDNVGISITTLSNSDYLVRSTAWDNAALTDAGAATRGNGSVGVAGTITTCNSVLGTTTSGGSAIVATYNTVYDYLIVGRPSDNIVTIYNPSGMALANSLDATTVNINGTNAIPLIASAACRIIATLTPNGGATAIKNTVNAKVWIEPSVPVFNVLPFVARHFEINPTTNAATATGRVTLYFTEAEFDDFNTDPGSFWNLPANAADAVGKGHLRVARYAGTTNNGSGLPGSYTPGALVIDPVDSDIVWNSSLSRWEVSFDVTGFGGFIVQTALYPLAVALDFTGRLQNNNALLNWQTTNEININSFVLERSTDGRNYTAVYNVAAYNTVGNHQYNFTDPAIDALNAAVVYYRIKQIAGDGQFTYSNIVALSPSGKNIVLLYPNPVQDKANLVITVNKPQQVQYRIIDNTGRIIAEQKHNLISGSNALVINVNNLPKGLYWIELKGATMNERKSFVKN